MYYCKSREGSTPLFNLLTFGNNKYCLLTDSWPSAKTNLRTPTTRNPELPTQVRNLKHDNNFGGPRTEASFSRKESHCLKPPLIPVCCTAITAVSTLTPVQVTVNLTMSPARHSLDCQNETYVLTAKELPFGRSTEKRSYALPVCRTTQL